MTLSVRFVTVSERMDLCILQSEGRIVTEFDRFEKLTSVHINSSDDQMLASGYTSGVKLYDIGTGQVRALVWGGVSCVAGGAEEGPPLHVA